MHVETTNAGLIIAPIAASHPLGRASIGYVANIRTMVEGLASGAGLRDPVWRAATAKRRAGGLYVESDNAGLERDNAHLRAELDNADK